MSAQAGDPAVAARITDHMNQLQPIIIDIRSVIDDLSPDPPGRPHCVPACTP
jgi:hypothetical protein